LILSLSTSLVVAFQSTRLLYSRQYCLGPIARCRDPLSSLEAC
jgi:hypothetical protein